MQRRPSFEQPSGLDEFSHLVMDYNPMDTYEGGAGPYGGENASPNGMALREREFMLRQKELALRERERNSFRRLWNFAEAAKGTGKVEGEAAEAEAEAEDGA